MSDDRRAELSDTADAVADGARVNWSNLPRDDPGLAAVLEELQAIEQIAAAHRLSHGEHVPFAEPDREGPRWGPFRLLEPLGGGNFGEVWRAYDPELQREVALKLRRLVPGEDAASLSATTDPRTRQWLEEARRLASVRHINVLTVFGTAEHGGRAGIWTELVGGETLEARFGRQGPMDPRAVAAIGRDLCAALVAVHGAGLVHGDVKASNVMIEGDGTGARVVLMDFGAAHRIGRDVVLSFSSAGTPLVMAPELLAGGEPSQAGDLYAVGVMMFRLLTGRYPVEATTFEELRARHLRSERARLPSLRAGLPPRLVRVVEQMLDPNPAARPGSGELRREIDAFLAPLTSTRVRIAIGAALLLALVAAFALVVLGQQLAMRDSRHFVAPPAPTLPISASAAWVTPIDEAQQDNGSVFTSRADLTGDGVNDLLVADQGYAGEFSGQGRVSIWRGSRSGLGDTAVWEVVGEKADMHLGFAAAAGGDVNGDGIPDVVLADRSEGRVPGRPVGAVRVYLGTPHGIRSAADQVLPGEEPSPSFARTVTFVGDIDHDGFDEVAVSEHNWNGVHRNQGRVRVYFGSATGLGPRQQLLLGDSQSSAFGWAIARAGDLNGDGYADLVVGAPWWKDPRGEVGAVHVFLGGPSGLRPAPRSRLTGDRNGDVMGTAMACVGDVNGDGMNDLAIGLEGHDGRGENVGEVRIYLGTRDGIATQPAWRVQGFGSYCYLGHSVSETMDVDGDGVPDLAVGGYGYGDSPDATGSGAVFLFRGAGRMRLFEKRPAWWTWIRQTEALFGSTVELADLDHDGLADIVVCAPRWRNGSVQVGRVFVFKGARPR